MLTNDTSGSGGIRVVSFEYQAPGGLSMSALAGSTVTTALGGLLTVNADGSWSYEPPASADHSTIESLPDGFSYTVTDDSGLTATASQPVFVTDTLPLIVDVENASIDNQAGISVTGSIEVEAADGITSFSLAPSLLNPAAGLSYAIDAAGTLIATDATGDTVFTLSVNASGEYTFTLLKPQAEVIALNPGFSGLVLEPGNPTTSAVTQLYASYDPVTGAGIGDPITSVVFSAGVHSLNPSADGLGVDNNLIDDPVNATPEVLSMAFADELSNASLHIGNLSNKDVLAWKVYQDGVLVDSGEISGSYIAADGSVVQISNSESPEYWIDLSRNGLDPDLRFDTLELSAADDSSYKFLDFSVEKPVTVDDMSLEFGFTALDGDGDPSEQGTLTVAIDGQGSEIADLPGDSVLAGGEGADVFRWTLTEPGAHDTVSDFDIRSPSSGGDVLDLRDLLPSDSVENLSSYLHFEDSGTGSTLVKISTEGAFTGNPETDASVTYQTIELQNVDLVGIGSDQDIINSLISNNKLITE